MPLWVEKLWSLTPDIWLSRDFSDDQVRIVRIPSGAMPGGEVCATVPGATSLRGVQVGGAVTDRVGQEKHRA